MPSEQSDRLERRVAAARWLRETRERAGYATAGDFARALDVERYQLSNWETGRSAIDDDHAARIAEVLGMPEIEVRRGLGLWVPEPDDDRDTPPRGPEASADHVRAAELVRRLEEMTAELRDVLGDINDVQDRDRPGRSA